MTDHGKDVDPAERVRQLQARRAAAGRTRRPVAGASRSSDAVEPVAAGPAAAGPSPGPRGGTRRRHHPAAASRWLLGGLSVASFFGIAGTIAAANVASVAAPAPTAATSAAPASATGSSTPAAATPVATKATSAKPASSGTARVAHTTTRGS